jgi:hypothetical protein
MDNGVGAIDGHNSIQTNVLALDKIATDDSSKRVNLTILSLIMVDAALFYSHIAHKQYNIHIALEQYSTYCEFFGQLADELIDNTIYDSMLRSTVNEGSAATGKRPKLRLTNFKHKDMRGRLNVGREDATAKAARGSLTMRRSYQLIVS